MHACSRWSPILAAMLMLVACGDPGESSPESGARPEPGSAEPEAAQLRAQVLSGINSFVGLQQDHYREHGTYAADLDAIGYEGDPAVQIEVREADDEGWSVVASHEDLEEWSCAAFTGEVEAVPMTSGGLTPEAGRVECDPLPGEGETEGVGGTPPRP